MWIENIDLDDFGCFQRARLLDLDDGLTVIAGPQRAGKSTFMDAIRRLGFGISRGDDIPPADGRYDVTATVVFDGYRYEVHLDNFASPKVKALDTDAPERTAQALFGGVRAAQYQQLFTVSLDELRSDPATLDDDADLSKVLLGAAYGDVADIPDIRTHLARSATDIGGKNGAASYRLKDPLGTIQDGIRERNDATSQVAEHELKTTERDETVARIEAIDRERDALELERTRLDAVTSGHETYETLQTLEADLERSDIDDVDSFPIDDIDRAKALAKDYDKAKECHEESIDRFRSKVGAEDATGLRTRLYTHRERIREFDSELSGWRERVRSLREGIEELDTERNQLRERTSKIHPGWDAELAHVREVEIDIFSESDVQGAVDRYRNVHEEIESLESDVEKLRYRRDELNDRIEAAVETVDEGSADSPLPTAVGGVVVALLAGGAASLLSAIGGVVVTAAVLVLTGAYVFGERNTAVPAHDGVSVDVLRTEREKVEGELSGVVATLRKRHGRRADAREQLDEVGAQFDLPEDATASAIGRFYGELVELEAAVSAYDRARENSNRAIEELRSELDGVSERLVEIGALDEAVDDSFAGAETVFAGVERAHEYLDITEAVVRAEGQVGSIEDELVAIVSNWDGIDGPSANDVSPAVQRFVRHGEAVKGIRETRQKRNRVRDRLRDQLRVPSVADSFAPLRDSENDGDDWHIAVYERVLDEYESVEEIDGRLDEIRRRFQKLEEEKEERRDERADIDTELASLASDEDVRKAHETIERGRRDLEPLAERYASLRIAEILLGKLNEGFIERATGPLLDEASEIFRRITGGEYEHVRSRDEFEDLDFEARLTDGSTHRTGELSRATSEQLFLSVRLARIKLQDEPLPVMLDDSLTNFDPNHVQRTLDVISELSETTQVFVLTCHPELLALLEATQEATYWCLEEGAFDGPYESTDAAVSLLSHREKAEPRRPEP